ncbi:MAG: methyltransferase domain-containing protein [Deltaproteobacteria bacterium]|jgi:SAM-dependent methyltransferase|nr:methyltransferase domain-containing protein [Deltaproteobacteria bacterium]
MADWPLPSLKLFDQAASEGRAETKLEATNYWDQRAPSYHERQSEGGNDDLHIKIIQALTRRTGLNASHRVLDIGCGPGRHSRLLAPIVGNVTAFDLSPTMIELAKTADFSLSQKIDFRVLDWDEADLGSLGWNNKFHLALASRTPAIHNLASLKKMIQAVSEGGYGALVSAVETRHSLRDPLLERWSVDPEISRAVRSVYLEINMLWLLGFYPEVSYFDQKWSASRSLAEAIYQQTRYLDRLILLSEDEKKFIAQSLTDLAHEGQVLEEVEAKTALVIWEIPPRLELEKS